MYRTGDLFRENPDGLLEFVGRADDLVKIMASGRASRDRGRTRPLPRPAHVAVVARENAAGTSGWPPTSVPAPDTDRRTGRLRAHALRLLPEYMVPAAYVPVDALPLTPNGKLDRARCRRPVFDQAAATARRRPRQEPCASLRKS